MSNAGFKRMAAFGLLALLASPAIAAPPKARPPATSSISLDQMDIVARSTEYDGQTHTYTVKGDVQVSLRDMLVTCEEATIFATPKEDRVERIVFEGKVQARRGSGVFKGEKVTYYVSQRRLLAEGGTHTRLLIPATGSAQPARQP